MLVVCLESGTIALFSERDDVDEQDVDDVCEKSILVQNRFFKQKRILR